MKTQLSTLVKPILFGIVAFILVLTFSFYIAFQQREFQNKKDQDDLLREANHIKDRFRNILYSDITAANALGIIYKEYGTPKNFDSIAAQIIRNNEYAEIIQLTENGIITHVYPIHGYESTIGINTNADSARILEAKRATEKQEVFFAGPRKLRQGGVGILGKVPIIIDKKSNALCVVLTKMETISNGIGLESNSKNKFSYELVKNSPGNDTSRYFLTESRPSSLINPVSIEITEGDWKLITAFNTSYKGNRLPLSTCVLGSLLALIFAVSIFRINNYPNQLKKIIAEKIGELSTKEEYYRMLIQTSSDAIVLIDEHGKIVYQTPSTEKISGYTLREMQEMDGLEIIHPDDRERDNKDFYEFAKTQGAIKTARHRLKHKKGHYIWIEGSYRNLLHEPSIKAIVFNYIDVTQRLASEEKEKETGALLKERLKELSVIYKISQFLQDENQNDDEILNEIVNVLPKGWQYPEICEAQIVIDEKVYRSQNYSYSPHAQAAYFKMENGSNGFVEVIYTEKRPENFEGPFLKEERDLINTMAEMLQRYFNKKNQKESLNVTEANIKSIFNNTNASFLLFDTNYNILAVNDYFQKGYKEQTGYDLTIGANFLESILPDRRDPIRAIVKQVLETNEPVSYESSYENKNEIKHFTSTISPAITNGEIIGFGYMGFEVTERKNMEIEIQNMLNERQRIIEDLTKRNRDLEQFSYIVSHNIRGPLANILGLVTMAGSDKYDLQTKTKALQGVNTAAKNLDSILYDLNDILQVRREVSERKTEVNFAEVIKTAKISLNKMISDSKAVVNHNFKEAESIHSIKSYQLNIFYNMINNSIKYSRLGHAPEINIWTEKKDDKIILNFKDNGIGIDLEKHKEYLFGLYKRFHLGVEGKGMGLFMVKTQTEVLGGSIEVRSKLEEGSHFILTFPLI